MLSVIRVRSLKFISFLLERSVRCLLMLLLLQYSEPQTHADGCLQYSDGIDVTIIINRQQKPLGDKLT